SAELLAQLISLGVFNVATEVARRHAVSFVADDQVPFRRRCELLLEILVPRQNIEASDQPVSVIEDVSRPRRLDHVTGKDIELERELFAEFVLPLLDETPRRDDQTPFEIAARDELLDQQACH